MRSPRMLWRSASRDGAERDLPDLRPAAHDDDPLAVDLRERGRRLDRGHSRHRPQPFDDRFNRALDRELQVDLRSAIDVLE